MMLTHEVGRKEFGIIRNTERTGTDVAVPAAPRNAPTTLGAGRCKGSS
jgi:hypothetical protein